MSQSFDLSGVTHVQLNGVDCPKLMLNGVRIWERYTATRQVWVTSGYSSTGWVTRGTRGGSRSEYYYRNTNNPYHTLYNNGTLGPSVYQNTNNTTWYVGSWRFVRHGSHSIYSQSKNGTRHWYYAYDVQESVTSWVDTSAYQTENYTAYYY